MNGAPVRLASTWDDGVEVRYRVWASSKCVSPLERDALGYEDTTFGNPEHAQGNVPGLVG